MNTREYIIEITRQLCNEYRASTITTNHIASEAGISPGNLYYHFKNKEEIIREIYADLFKKADALWFEPSFQASEYGIVNYLFHLNGVLYEYRFCYRELNLLLSRDNDLKILYVERSRRLLEHINTVIDSWIDVGIMKPLATDEERGSLIMNFHIVMLFWISYVDMLHDEITPEIIRQGVKNFILYFKPYFRAKSWRIIEELLKSEEFQLD